MWLRESASRRECLAYEKGGATYCHSDGKAAQGRAHIPRILQRYSRAPLYSGLQNFFITLEVFVQRMISWLRAILGTMLLGAWNMQSLRNGVID